MYKQQAITMESAGELIAWHGKLLALMIVVGVRVAKWKGCLSWGLWRSLDYEKDNKKLDQDTENAK